MFHATARIGKRLMTKAELSALKLFVQQSCLQPLYADICVLRSHLYPPVSPPDSLNWKLTVHSYAGLVSSNFPHAYCRSRNEIAIPRNRSSRF